MPLPKESSQTLSFTRARRMSHRIHLVWSFVVAAPGCVSASLPAPEPVRCDGICSDGSGYAPVAQLFVSRWRTGDSLVVRVDSGTVGTPTLRRAASLGPTSMASLTLRAFVAQSDFARMSPGPLGRDASTGSAWTLIAQGEAWPLATALAFGEVLPVPRSEFHIVLPRGIDTSKAWLGFEIAGDAIDPRVESRARGTTRGGVRVYVCDPRTLSGVPDDARAQRLHAAYGAVC